MTGSKARQLPRVPGPNAVPVPLTVSIVITVIDSRSSPKSVFVSASKASAVTSLNPNGPTAVCAPVVVSIVTSSSKPALAA